MEVLSAGPTPKDTATHGARARSPASLHDWSNPRASESRNLVTADVGLRTGGRKALREGKLSKKPTLLYTYEQSRVVMMRAQPMS